MRILTYIFFVLLVIFGLTFAGLNAEPVVINYYIGSYKVPLSLLLIMSFIIGVLLCLLSSLLICIRLKTSNLRLKQRLKIVEEELANLRALPLKDES